jgi:rubrerythrin
VYDTKPSGEVFNLKDTELKVIQTAIINELEGYEFYKMAHSQADDEEVKAAFLKLADEERKHIEWLKDLFEQIKDSMDDVINLTAIEAVPGPGIFKWENLDRKHAGLAVSAFGIGIQLERMSVEFYDKAAKNTTYPAARSLFETLSKWEQVHLDTFSQEFDKLQAFWWADQGFAPF